MAPRRRTLTDDSGAAAVEFAIILPLLLMLILLLIDFGRLFFVEISLNSASREGARASALGMSASQVQTIVLATAPGASAMASLSSSTLSINTQSCAINTDRETTTVDVHATFHWLTPISLVQMFDQGTQLGDASGLGMDLVGHGVMLCTES
ncbi:MAG: TadE/TadG family type IV pilus assembly protein [Actinomycetes bacterium]